MAIINRSTKGGVVCSYSGARGEPTREDSPWFSTLEQAVSVASYNKSPTYQDLEVSYLNLLKLKITEIRRGQTL